MRGKLGAAGVIAAGMLLSAAIGALSGSSVPGQALAALLCTGTLFGGDALASLERGESPLPSRRTFVLAGALLIASGIVLLVSPRDLALFMPVLASSVAMPVLQRLERRRTPCR